MVRPQAPPQPRQREPHDGTKRAEVAALARLLDPLRNAAGLVLAVSGGPDSTALMHLAAHWRQADGPNITVATVDHGLRPNASNEAAGVVAAANRLGFEAVSLTWTGPKPTRGIPARARAARYDLLSAYARRIGASHLVTAHTADDQAETVLLRIASGSGTLGLAGMRAQSDVGDGLTLARPLLSVRKHQLVDLCESCGWHFVDDPTNRDPAYARARWRRLAPALATEGATAERLAALAGRMARVEDALQHWTAELTRDVRLEGDGAQVRLSMHKLTTLPEEMSLRLIGEALVEASGRAGPKLKGLEALTAELIQACNQSAGVRRTFHHCTATLHPDGVLELAPEGPRHRGRRRTFQHAGSQTGANDAAPPASLGKAAPSTYIGAVVAPARESDVGETHGTSVAPAREPMLSTGPQ